MGRATQGVTLIAVEDGTKLSGLQRIAETDIEEVDAELGEQADQAEQGDKPAEE
jgi:DNA gyrase subunit A